MKLLLSVQLKNSIALLFTIFTFVLQGQGMSQIKTEDFDSIQLYTLTNASGASIKVTNYGAIITSINVPDQNGKLADIALGYHHLENYMNAIDRPYFGAVVGRYGNRIAKGSFTIDGVKYSVPVNNGVNHLHGGIIGFDKVVWEAKPIQVDSGNAIELSYISKDGNEGYPGNLTVKVTYTFTNANELKVDYHATTDKSTPINLTQHTYFNLKGEGQGNILDHDLMINAKAYTPIDAGSIPIGKIQPLADTPFDFTTSKLIGRDIGQDNEQLKFGIGYDHNFVLDKGGNDGSMTLAAKVIEPASGRVMEVLTTEPGVQFYCGNFLDGRLVGKSGKNYVHRGGFCLETQHYPDSPNQPNFPSTILKPGQTYQTSTVFKFSTTSSSSR